VLVYMLLISTKKLSNCILITSESLYDFLAHNTLEYSSICISENSLKIKVLKEVENFILKKKANLMNTIYYQIHDEL